MNLTPKNWLTFVTLEIDEEITISYGDDLVTDLNDNKFVDDQIHRAGRRLKRRLGQHPCRKNAKMYLHDWSDSFEEASQEGKQKTLANGE